jgi:cyclomaltodextrinase
MQIKKAGLLLSMLLVASIHLNAQNAWAVLASPFQFQVDTSKLIISDYFPFNASIDSVQVPKGIKKISLTKEELWMHGKPANLVSYIRFYIKNEVYDLPCFAADKENVSLTIQLEKPVSKLEIKGTFSSWAPSSKGVEPIGTLPSTNWKINLQKVNRGKHQYKLIADGVEVNPVNASTVSNGMGGTNVSLEVGSAAGLIPSIETKQFEGSTISLNTTNVEGYLVFWNQRLLINNTKKTKSITFNIPEEARAIKRSYIRVYAYGSGTIARDVLIPLENGRVVSSTSLLDRHDLHTQIMYFMMVDRFVDGDKNNNPSKLEGVHEKADFYGGDLLGIQKKLENGFFEELGFNTIWLSPIAKNPEGAWGYWNKTITTKFSAYHGYWPTSYSLVDRRFGTNESFEKFLSLAHEKETNVVLDFVAHHIHTDHPLYSAHPNWVTSLYLPDGSMNTERWDDHRLTTWFDTFLPTLDFQNDEVNEVISDSVMYWVRNFEIDGFRHDASKHVPEVFWRTLTRKIRNEVREKNRASFYQIGETYGSPELIGSYVNSGQMDGQFDFNLYDAGVNAFAFDADKTESIKKFKRLSETINESFKYYGTHHLMGNISGNQDKPRFASLAEGTIKPEEDTKLAGWTRDIQHVGTKGYLRMAQMMALNFSLPGVPVVYYGDEIAMPGGNDPDNRRMMKFENYTPEEKALREKVQLLASLRKNNLELLYGDFKELPCTEGFYAFERNYFGRKTIVVFAKNAGQVKIATDDRRKLKANFSHPFQASSKEITVELSNDDFEILTYE